MPGAEIVTGNGVKRGLFLSDPERAFRSLESGDL